MRDINSVIEAVIAAVPKDFEGREAVVSSLESVKAAADCTAPEDMGTRWREAAVIIGRNLGPLPDDPSDWRHKAAKIFAGTG